MQLYYHQTGGGAEYYSTTFTVCQNGEREGTMHGVIMRTEGGESEILTEQLKKLGIKMKNH